MAKYASVTCRICKKIGPANKFYRVTINSRQAYVCSRKHRREAEAMDQTGGVQTGGVQTSGVQAQKARTDKDRSVLAKLVVWFFFWPFKILFASIVYLLPLIWAILKFIFNIVKKLFVKATDQDGDGDVDLDDIKLILKKFTTEGRADSAERKLEKVKKKQREKEERELNKQKDIERLAKAKEERAKLEAKEK